MSCHVGGINLKEDQISDFYSDSRLVRSDDHTSINSYLMERVGELYGRTGEMKKKMQADRKSHREALEKIGAAGSNDPSEEPAAKIKRLYEEDLDAVRIAAESLSRAQ